MSKSGKKKQNTTEPQEKVLTRYDLKMQRRREQKKKEERDKKIAAAVGILLVAGLVCLVASFPIRTYLTVHGRYIVVAGEAVSRVEFDYNYNLAMNSYLNENYYYMSLFGIDLSGDLSRQMYSDTLTWQDFFEEKAVDNLIRSKALQREMEAAGFTYDVTGEYEVYTELLRSAASAEGMSVGAYVQELFGPYATLSRIEDFLKEGMMTSAYLDSVAESRTPSDEEIQAYYESEKDSYDSVDYRLTLVEAELPTEPTELADPVDETEGAEGEDASAEDGGEAAYEPSEAEIEFAMEQAREEAEKAEKTVFTRGELNENLTQDQISYLLTEWLFDGARVSGDTTIIEDGTNHRYYVVAFVDRYLDSRPAVDLRVIMTQDGNAQAILDEWTAGEATEDSFAALADQYNSILVTNADGGLYEALAPSDMPEEMAEWIYGESRVGGDTAVFAPEEEDVSYVVYYIGENEPQWKLSIRSILLEDIMADYMEEIIQDITVEDPKGNLYYLQVQAQEESDVAEGGDGAEGSDEDGNISEEESGE